MNPSEQQCKEFKKNPTINPLTGRHIQIGKVTHQMLTKACDKKSPKRVSTEKVFVPPMGPVMHYKVRARTNLKKQNNLIDQSGFIEERLDKIEKGSSYSRMEIEEFQDILKDAKSEFEGEKEYLDYYDQLLDRIKTLRKSKMTVVDDRPKHTVVGNTVVHPRRNDIREEIAVIWNIYNTSLLVVEDTMKTQTVDIDVVSGVIRDLQHSWKKYLDYLIKHHIFTYDDIYKKTFDNENVFEELAEKYKKYREIYKKVKGKSPI